MLIFPAIRQYLITGTKINLIDYHTKRNIKIETLNIFLLNKVKKINQKAKNDFFFYESSKTNDFQTP